MDWSPMTTTRQNGAPQTKEHSLFSNILENKFEIETIVDGWITSYQQEDGRDQGLLDILNLGKFYTVLAPCNWYKYRPKKLCQLGNMIFRISL